MSDAAAPSARRVSVLARGEGAAAQLFAERCDARLARAFAQAGASAADVVMDASALHAKTGALTVLARGDAVLDARLVAALLGCGELLLAAKGTSGEGIPIAAAIASERAAVAAAWLAGGAAPASVRIARAEELVPAYTSELRKLAPPFLLVAMPANVREIERALFDASYKGVTDFVTKFVWPTPAFHVVRACARLGISPNAVTLVSWLLVALATLWFARAEFGLGLAAAWGMTFLDTVDGKLARVTLRSSPIGHALDHGLDILHPPVWWAAWAFGLAFGGPWLTLAALVVVGGYVVGRLLEGAFMLVCGFETHSWRPIDGFFRLITARRNPNLVLLTACTLVSEPRLGYQVVAAWTGLSLAFHAMRLLQAIALRLMGRKPQPWEQAS